MKDLERNNILFGAAYYPEYMPYERLQEDIAMMQEAGMNTVRIAESTWSTLEPVEGKFDFSYVDKVLAAVEKAGMYAVIGTPTYAIPSWLEKKCPEVMVFNGYTRAKYGRRQIMDIVHPVFRQCAENVICRLLEHTAKNPCVIGFQIDNETKHYGTASPEVQAMFVEYLKEQFVPLFAIFAHQCTQILHRRSLNLLKAIEGKNRFDGIENIITTRHFYG